MNRVTIPFERVNIGDDVTACWPDGHGQGGVVEAIRWPNVVLICGDANYNRIIDAREVHWEIEVPMDAEECLNFGPDCSGPVDYWHSGGMNGRSWPRCTFHGEKRLKDASELERYADSDVAPPWYHDSDEYYAHGQEWGDDD